MKEKIGGIGYMTNAKIPLCVYTQTWRVHEKQMKERLVKFIKNKANKKFTEDSNG